jgi:hypothetical protein
VPFEPGLDFSHSATNGQRLLLVGCELGHKSKSIEQAMPEEKEQNVNICVDQITLGIYSLSAL